jgi:hypothetical protein
MGPEEIFDGVRLTGCGELWRDACQRVLAAPYFRRLIIRARNRVVVYVIHIIHEHFYKKLVFVNFVSEFFMPGNNKRKEQGKQQKMSLHFISFIELEAANEPFSRVQELPYTIWLRRNSEP